MKRIYHPYYNWEEIKAGMWEPVSNQEEMLQKAIEFTGDHALYGSYMLRVVNEWPISCENSLTSITINRKAWLGHAACAMAIRCPENITRQAWGFLTEEQRILANKQAEEKISIWERKINLKRISELGKKDVTWMAFPMKFHECWKQLTLFHLTEELQ